MYDKEVYHFLFLHFPIALFVTGYLFHVFFIISDKLELKKYMLWTMGMSIIWSVASIITGYITAIEMEYISSLSGILEKQHSYIMILATILFILTFILSNKNFNTKVLLFFHSLAVIILLYGTHLGAIWSDRI